MCALNLTISPAEKVKSGGLSIVGQVSIMEREEIGLKDQ